MPVQVDFLYELSFDRDQPNGEIVSVHVTQGDDVAVVLGEPDLTEARDVDGHDAMCPSMRIPPEKSRAALFVVDESPDLLFSAKKQAETWASLASRAKHRWTLFWLQHSE